MIKRFGLWLLSLFLKGLGIKMGEEQVNVAERKADAAIARNDSIMEGKELEKKQIVTMEEIKKKHEEEKKARPADDVMGTDDWNKGK